MQHLTKYILIVLIFTSVNRGICQEINLENTFRKLNFEFKTFRISRAKTKLDGVELFKYEFPLQGLETDSKQNLTGVSFYIDDEGHIVLVRPICVKRTLPDQSVMNEEINSGNKASEIFSKFDFENLGEIQIFGFLHKWSVSVLSRKDGVTPNLNLNDEQKSRINGLFNGQLRLPDLELDNDKENVQKIEKFAKKVLQFDIVPIQ